MPRRPVELTASLKHAEPVREIGCAGTALKPRARKVGMSGKTLLHTVVRIPEDLPVTQIEIEVIASLLDDWESLFPIVREAAE